MTSPKSPALVAPPVAKKVPHVVALHGQNIVDDYAWMRNLPTQDPDLIPHLEAENAHAVSYMADTVDLQEKLYQEMRSRIKEADQSVAAQRGRWFYYTRTEEGKQYSIYCRRGLKPGSPEQVILDVNELAAAVDFFEVETIALSPSGNFLAYLYDDKGFRQYKLVVKNLRSGKILATTAERVTSVVWASDNKTIFYTTEDAVTKRSDRVYRHKIGSKRHQLVCEEADEFFGVHLSKTRTGFFIYLSTSSHTTASVSYIRSNSPLSPFKEILPRKHMVDYEVEDDGKNFYILTNDDAKDYRLLKAPCRTPSKWQEVLAHRPGIKLDGVDVFANFLIVFETDQGLDKIRITKLSTGEVHYVDFPEPAYALSGAANHIFDSEVYRFGYQSMVQPPSTFEYDLNKRTTEVLKTQEVKGYDPSAYHSERVFATASDGTLVPISLVYKNQLEKPRQCHLYGYGSYGISIPSGFSSARVSLLDRGYIYAIAHIRGGGDMGETWRDDGKLRKKMNTFTDFIACAEHLIAEGYTTREQLSIEGGSAGGLLMGAVLNLRPDLFNAAIVDVPFVDVINTMLDESLPLTVGEFEEWGNPKVEADYNYMRLYSPYENIHAAHYPAMLVQSAFYDSQVPYWEPSKYTAKLRATKLDTNPLIYKIMLEAAGHGGKSGRFDALKDVAFEYAFLLKQQGLSV
jgi:oligopeptidase B